MSDIILKAENISKQYRLGLVGLGTLGHDFNRFWHKIRGKEDPYLKVGSVNDRSAKASSEYVWALQDINFEVKRGEVLGIIGRNGAGKSTLLKLLSRVTAPTTGSIKTRGRIASLLEVGTGMHPELTGRENIFLNGAILGMTKVEIASKINEIIAFSGCEMYIDTPVKRYSSGMRVRLGFAVAAFLEPDILVVDEVLAVGDAEFQKKAIGKMKDISTTGGRTVLFVSHDMTSVKSLCTRAIVLSNGTTVYDGSAEDAISYYLSSSLKEKKAEKQDLPFYFVDFDLIDQKGRTVESVISGEDVIIRISYEVNMEIDEKMFFWAFSILDHFGNIITGFSSIESGIELKNYREHNFFEWRIKKLGLRAGNYSLKVFSSYNSTSPKDFLHVEESFGTINVIAGDFWKTGRTNRKGNDIILDGNLYLTK